MTGSFESRTKEAQRMARLCKVVERVAASVFEEMGADEVLRHCQVLSAMRGASRACIVVDVGLRLSSRAPGILEVHRALGELSGRLRAEIARATNRKRAPLLAFNVVPLAEAGRAGPE